MENARTRDRFSLLIVCFSFRHRRLDIDGPPVLLMTLHIKTVTPGQKLKPVKVKYRVTEADVEAILMRQVKRDGGTTWKWMSPSNRSVHDRICIFPGADIWLVEAKAPDGKKSPGQKNFHLKLYNDLGCKRSITVWCKEDVMEFLRLRRKLAAGRPLNDLDAWLLKELQIGRIKR